MYPNVRGNGCRKEYCWLASDGKKSTRYHMGLASRDIKEGSVCIHPILLIVADMCRTAYYQMASTAPVPSRWGHPPGIQVLRARASGGRRAASWRRRAGSCAAAAQLPRRPRRPRARPPPRVPSRPSPAPPVPPALAAAASGDTTEEMSCLPKILPETSTDACSRLLCRPASQAQGSCELCPQQTRSLPHLLVLWD